MGKVPPGKVSLAKSSVLGLVIGTLLLAGCVTPKPDSPPVPRYVPDPPTAADYQGNTVETGVGASLSDVLYVSGGLTGCATGSDEGCEGNFAGGQYRGSQTFDVYEPPASAPMAPSTGRPVIVWIHGGFAVSGDKTDVGNRDYPANLLARQIARGYVVISLNYRLNITSPGPNGTIFPLDPVAAEDLDVAVRYMKANSSELGIDPKRIILWGHSWGAWAALMQATASGVRTPAWLPTELAAFSPVVAATVAESGPSDLTATIPVALREVERTSDLGPIDLDSIDPAELEANSPLRYVDRTDSPIYAMSGPIDPLIPLSDPESMADAYAAIARTNLYRLDIVDRAAGAALPWAWQGHLTHPGANRSELERFLDQSRR
ncbi:MAG TPA: alpha/beta hydrolase [Microthrixaceae bacterium]|nr:alpha/beta hydrolase [Microthrixaceae bacterium]